MTTNKKRPKVAEVADHLEAYPDLTAQSVTKIREHLEAHGKTAGVASIQRGREEYWKRHPIPLPTTKVRRSP
jgi:hypothetical protein